MKVLFLLFVLSALCYGTGTPKPLPPPAPLTHTATTFLDTLPPVDSMPAPLPSPAPVVHRYGWGTQSVMTLGTMVIDEVPYKVEYLFRRIKMADGGRGRHLWVWMSATDTVAYEENRGALAHPYFREGVVYWNGGQSQLFASSIAADWARWGKEEMICVEGERAFCLLWWGNPYDEQPLD